MINPLAAVQKSWLSIWPVIQRELRAGSHASFNYWMRVVAGAIATVQLLSWMAVTMASGITLSGPPGLELFDRLHIFLIVLAFVFVPAMTADCLAREQREGTLGLLFLTPLTAGGVVVGKSIAQGLRAWCLWLSVVPALVVPLILGGLGWDVIARSLATEFSVIVLGLASGLLASCLTTKFLTAVAFAEILTLIASYFATALVGFALIGGGAGIAVQTRYFGPAGYTSGSTINLLPPSWLPPLGTGMFAAAALCYLAVVLIFASRWVKRSWQDRPPSRRKLWWTRTFCTDLFRNRFKRKLGRVLEGNPIAWLQLYSWKSRVLKWTLCLLFILGQSLVMMKIADKRFGSLGFLDSMPIQLWMAAILAVLYTYAGVSSFVAEKKTGALELILITPITVGEIIIGRAWGLYKQFFPALVTLLGFQAAMLSIDTRLYSGGENIVEIVASLDWDLVCIFLTLPIYATYAALRVKWTIGGIALTWIALVLALIFPAVMGPDGPGAFAVMFTLSSLLFACLTFFLLHHSLSRRIYSFS